MRPFLLQSRVYFFLAAAFGFAVAFATGLAAAFVAGLAATFGFAVAFAAGLAAAFNAPLAGVIFGLEEMQKTISPALLLTGITASITAATVTEVVFGMSPVFSMGYLLPLPLNLFDVLVAAGIVIGLLGRLFNIALAYSLNTYSRLGLSGMKKPLVPLVLAGILGFVLPEILGGGNLLVDSLVVTDYTIGFLCFLFVGKFLFTMIGLF